MPQPGASQPTFLFSDIVGSTGLWQADQDAMAKAMARHDEIVDHAIASHGGRVVKNLGDGIFAVFPEALGAVSAALAMREAMDREPWPLAEGLRVRIGIHRGPAEAKGEDFYGPEVNRCSRLQELAHGGQVLVSAAAAGACQLTEGSAIALRDLGLHRLRDMIDSLRIHQADVAHAPREFPALRSIDALPNNLPLQHTRFFGRQEELSELSQALTSQCVVTLTGPGGCGKTRTALELAARVLDRYPDGVWYVPLGALADASLVPTAVASVLGVADTVAGESPTQAIVRFAADKTLLVVLDNCEHLIDACARLAAQVIGQCAGLAMVATSREALAIPGEWVYPLSPLDSSGDGREASELFIDRVGMIRRGYEPGGAELAIIDEIVHRLDGIPLAIELAAARCGALSARQIADRLDDRFELLSRGPRTADPRHRALRATIDWSYELLDPACQPVLHAASVFAGGFDAEALEAVCEPLAEAGTDVLGCLSDLVAASMVVAEDTGDAMRYRMLETIREYALGRTAEHSAAMAVRRHGEHFAGRLRDLVPQPSSTLSLGASEILSRDYDNLRAALAWAIGEDEGPMAADMAARLAPYWRLKGYLDEGRTLLRRVLASAGSYPPALHGDVLRGAAALAFDQGDHAEAERLWQEALEASEAARDERGIASSLGNLGNLSAMAGRRDSARQAYHRVLEIMRALGNERGAAAALANLGSLARSQGNLEEADTLLREALAIMRELPDLQNAAHLARSLGLVAAMRDEPSEAASHYRESIELARRLGDRRTEAMALNNLGVLALQGGRAQEALEQCAEAVRLRREIGDERGAAVAGVALAEAQALSGDLEAAAATLVSSLSVARTSADARLLIPPIEVTACIAETLGDADLARALLGTTNRERGVHGMERDPRDAASQAWARLGPPSPDHAMSDLGRAADQAQRLLASLCSQATEDQGTKP